jgi:hypothetical protein
MLYIAVSTDDAFVLVRSELQPCVYVSAATSLMSPMSPCNRSHITVSMGVDKALRAQAGDLADTLETLSGQLIEAQQSLGALQRQAPGG